MAEYALVEVAANLQDTVANAGGLFGQPLPPGTEFTSWYDLGRRHRPRTQLNQTPQTASAAPLSDATAGVVRPAAVTANAAPPDRARAPRGSPQCPARTSWDWRLGVLHSWSDLPQSLAQVRRGCVEASLDMGNALTTLVELRTRQALPSW